MSRVVNRKRVAPTRHNERDEMVASIVATIIQNQSSTMTQLAEVAVRTAIDKTEEKNADGERLLCKRKNLWPLLKKIILTKRGSDDEDEEDEEDDEFSLEEDAKRARMAIRDRLKASREMDLLDNEKALLKYLSEFRLRPSKVSAEFFYNSKTRDSWETIEKTLFLWLDIFSEFEALPETTFKELFNLVKSLRSLDENNTAETYRVFFLLRTHARRLISEKSELLDVLVVNLSVKSLVCQLFIALMEDNVTNIYKSITLSLYEEDKVKMLRSVLSSLTKNHLVHLRNRLTDGHARADYTCPCHIGKVAQHLKKIGISLVAGRDEEDESPQCEVLLFLDEVNSLLELMDSPQFYTKAHELHKIAERDEFARHFELKNKKVMANEKLLLEEEEEAEKEMEKEDEKGLV